MHATLYRNVIVKYDANTIQINIPSAFQIFQNVSNKTLQKFIQKILYYPQSILHILAYTFEKEINTLILFHMLQRVFYCNHILLLILNLMRNEKIEIDYIFSEKCPDGNSLGLWFPFHAVRRKNACRVRDGKGVNKIIKINEIHCQTRPHLYFIIINSYLISILCRNWCGFSYLVHDLQRYKV